MQPVPSTTGPDQTAGANPAPLTAGEKQADGDDDDSEDKALDKLLRTVHYQVQPDAPCPKIKGGFLPGLFECEKYPKIRLRVIIPIIPQYCIGLQDQQPTPNVTAMELDQADVDAISQADARCLYLARNQRGRQPGKVRYFCASWLALGVEMREHTEQWEVVFMAWQDFTEAVIDREGHVWELLSEADLLVGGVNFTSNFLEESSSTYGLTIWEMDKLWSGMGNLAQKLTIWPDPRDLLFAGSKLFLNTIICKSSAAMGLFHPRAKRASPSIIKDVAGGKIDAVLKREFSSHTRHVYTPHTVNAERKLKQAVVEEKAAYLSFETQFPRPKWYIQPYIAPLVYLGEVRAFIVNGVFFNSCVTTPKGEDALDNLDIQRAILFTPLSKLRLTPEDRKTKNMPWLVTTTLSPHQVGFENSLPDFALKMLSRLILAEEFYTKRRSCMRIFVRMDISVFQWEGKFQYMVNELTRSHQTSLFLNEDDGRMDFLFSDLASVLRFVAFEDYARRRSPLHPSA